MNSGFELSVIIPTYNEETNITKRLSEIISPEIEIIVVDGGSTDQTIEKVKVFSANHPHIKCIQTAKGRAIQMNSGAKLAIGKTLVFLHADTVLPLNSIHILKKNIQEGVIAGAFLHKLAGDHFFLRYLEWYGKFKSKYLKIPFGDQVIFLLKSYFIEIGGFREDYPIFEDIELVLKIRKNTKFKILDGYVFTSARRYEKEGYLKRGAKNILLQASYFIGIHPKNFVKWYL